MSIDYVECSTQAAVDQAVADGNIPVVRAGYFEASGKATVSASGKATVRASGKATVSASGKATVRAYDEATVSASGEATVSASGKATVRAYDEATVRAYGKATVRASGKATVSASGKATVRASGEATVSAYGEATVSASGKATVRAYDEATVSAYGEATVSASGKATVSASPFVAVHRTTHYGLTPTVTGGVLIEVPDTRECDAQTWVDFYGLDVEDGQVTVYKGVGDDLRSERGFMYPLGENVAAPDFKPSRECGHGLHFSPRPFLTHLYCSPKRYLECRVPLAALLPMGDKCKAPGCAVVREVDVDGEPIVSDEPAAVVEAVS